MHNIVSKMGEKPYVTNASFIDSPGIRTDVLIKKDYVINCTVL